MTTTKDPSRDEHGITRAIARVYVTPDLVHELATVALDGAIAKLERSDLTPAEVRALHGEAERLHEALGLVDHLVERLRQLVPSTPPPRAGRPSC